MWYNYHQLFFNVNRTIIKINNVYYKNIALSDKYLNNVYYTER